MQAAYDVDKALQQSKARQAWFESLVRSQEELANRDPVAYQRKLMWFGYLGYIYVFGILLLVIAFIAGIVALMVYSRRGNALEVKLIIFAGLVLIAILRSLWVRIDPPEGLVLDRSESPVLYREVEKIAERLQAPKPEEIRLNPQLNAAAEQYPRLGIFGWHKNVLHLGLPLLLTLSPDEARSVIAHELGHFSGEHGKFGAWAYRLNQIWAQLYQNLARHGGSGAWLFSGFIRWFAPRFEALSFALRRANEYQADRAAAEVAGPSTAARALMRLPYLDDHLDNKFWEPLFERAKTEPHPPRNAFLGMRDAAKLEGDPEKLRRQLELALALKTDYDDSHPCLTDRLRGLREPVPDDLSVLANELAIPLETSAAEEFFGDSLPTILQRLELQSAEAMQAAWTAAHSEYSEKLQRFEELDRLSAEKPLTEDEEVERAVCMTFVKPEPETLTEFVRLSEKYPDNPVALFLRGDLMLKQGDEGGLHYLDEAVRRDPDFALQARQSMAEFHVRLGRHYEVEKIRERAFEDATRQHLDQELLDNLHPSLPYGPHSLTHEQVQDLVRQMRAVNTLGLAYLVKLTLPATGRQMHVVYALPKRKLIELGKEPADLVQRLTETVSFPSNTYVVSDPQNRKTWEKVLKAIPSSLILDQ